MAKGLVPKHLYYPKITMVTPNYNMAEYLEKTIHSVIHQDYPDLEYIIIDGKSNDDSLNIIKKHEKNLAYWVSEPDAGLYHALQKGFARSTGEIMMWLNSDDMLHPKALFTVAEIFTSFPQIEWLTGARSSFDELGRTVKVNPSRRWSKYHFYTRDYRWIQQESTVWRRSLWERAGSHMNTEIKYAADFELWVRFFRSAKLHTTTGLIGGFRKRHSGQLSSSHLKEYLKECDEIIRKEKSTLENEVKRNLKWIGLYNNLIAPFRKLKIFNSEAIDRFILKQFNEIPPLVTFDKKDQKYKLRN